MTNNYFKVGNGLRGHRLFFFDDRDPASAREAYDAANTARRDVADEGMRRRSRERISVYAPPRSPGPWCITHLIGEIDDGSSSSSGEAVGPRRVFS